MKYVSIFSGIEAASVAWAPLGWEALAFAEIDDFPSAVLKKRYPDVPNLGDVTQIDWSDVVSRIGKPDLIVGGSPCQSFSIAGNREGLKGASGLMYEYIRAVSEVRPRWFLWENVPGALSVEGGGAFGQLLSEMANLGYGLAWRVLDAQFCRVPVYADTDKLIGFVGPVAQRRRRVFLVGSLGTDRASQVLFEPEGMCGNPISGRKKREEITRAVEGSPASRGERTYCIKTAQTGSNGSNVTDDGAAYTLSLASEQAICFTQNTRDEVRYVNGDGQLAGALCAEPGTKQQNYVLASAAANTEIGKGGLVPTITAHAAKDAPILCVGSDTSKAAIDENLASTLHVGGGQPFIAAPVEGGRRC